MADNNNKGPHCELSKQFKGAKRLIHEVLMETELYNGYGAYILSYADTKDPENKSGLSFGVNQMDMSKRRDAVTIFKNILENAKDNRDQYIIPRNKINAIKKVNFTETKKTPEQIFGKDLPLVNAALSSSYGIQKINEQYITELDERIEHIEKAISMMKNPAAKEFYNSNLGKVFLFEYHNQFVLDLKGSFMTEYIDGKYNKLQREDYKTHEKYTAPNILYTLADHKKFIYGTYQYDKTPTVINNRLTKAENTYNKYALLAFSEEMNLVDLQIDMVAILDNYEDAIANIFNKYTDGKTKSTAIQENYLNGSENWIDSLLSKHSCEFKNTFINDEINISNDSQSVNFIEVEHKSILKSDFNFEDTPLSSNIEINNSAKDHFCHLEKDSSLLEKFTKENSIEESGLSKTMFLQIDEVLNKLSKFDEIPTVEILEEKTPKELYDEIPNIIFKNPLKEGELLISPNVSF